MKKFISLFLAVALCISMISIGMITSTAATTETFTENGISWKVTESYPGWVIQPTDRNSISGEVIIPATHNGKVIIAINGSAFERCSNLTSVVIPDSIVSIGMYAFMNCTGLTSITIPDSVTDIGSQAFSGCTNVSSLHLGNNIRNIDTDAFCQCNITDVVIPNSVKNLSGFCGTPITSITIPNSVTSIGPSAFSSCRNLTSVTIPNSVTDIGSYAFNTCTGLTTISIPASVKNIGWAAFEHCSQLSSVELQNGIEYIDAYAFYDCSRLTSVSIPSSVAYIGKNAFPQRLNISTTSEVSFTDDNGFDWKVSGYSEGWSIKPADKNTVGADITIPSSYMGKPIVAIDIVAFDYCKNLKHVSLPNSITTIRNGAFSGCSNLTNINIPNSVISIEGDAFHYCAKLTSISIPNSVVNIGRTAFCASGITSLTIPDSVQTIGEGAFEFCSGLKNSDIIIPRSIEWIGEYAFAYIGHINSVTLNNTSISQINGSAFYNNTIGEIVLGDSLQNIDTPLLSGNPNLTELTLNPNIKVTNQYAFYGNDNLTINAPAQAVTPGLLRATTLSNTPLRIIGPIVESGGSSSSIVTLTNEKANLMVTVPTVLPVSVDADNRVTVANNAQIQNLSNGPVDVTNAALSGSNTWSLAAFDTDFRAVPVNTKQYGFKLLGYNVPVSGNAYNNQFDTIAGNASLDLNYDANVAIQSEAISAAEIGNIVFTVAWHK